MSTAFSKINTTKSSHNTFATNIFDEDVIQNIRNNNFKIRYWSYIIIFKKHGYTCYAKIPKCHSMSSDILHDISDEENQLIASNEIDCLIELNEMFGDAPSELRVVELLGYSQKFNCIITKEFEGESLYDKSTKESPEYLGNYYSAVGKWLNYFHGCKIANDCDKIIFYNDERALFENLLEWLSMYCEDLYLTLNKILPQFLSQNKQQIGDLCVYTLSGFELRNFLINNDGSVCFLDPTEIVRGSQMDDIARFVVSIDMIPWGHLDAYIGKDYNNLKETFLMSYFGNEYESINKILALYAIKWLLIRWRETCSLLDGGKVFKLIRPVVAKYYSDYLFKRWIRMYLSELI
ncbi:hypothetical protein [Methanosarcina sp. 2.H.A.1B.4]|uniref:hypothetical protein n=1 Tax=Methanosarcina sp. 2.H.A.1B.4 TaxID=1483600 RepID=UPI00062204D3|nr:hypothetical protein [Methanosarcina sp. 2.H.A.1B.4]KKG09294.1 hypothetical protein EO92_06125 [Methanosarcina sp. 2.H.A.1B.4]